MAVVRTSTLNIPADRLDEMADLMKHAEPSLAGIRQLKGLKAYFAGIDREKAQMTNVSIWETVEDAKQMDTFQPMQDLAKSFMGIPGISFVRPIPNFEVLWSWGDAAGGSQS
jgi:hypothetical protein